MTPTGNAAAPWALELSQLTKRFGATEVIRGIDLAVASGERVAIIGPNGAGKSTLFNLMSGRCAPTSGQIRLGGRRIDGLKPFEIQRMGVSRSFQVTHIFAQLSVFENLRCSVMWRSNCGYQFLKNMAGYATARARANELLRWVELDHKRDALAGDLTYAEQRALELAMTLGSDAPVILLDEPTAGMSQSETRRFISLIAQVTAGKTLLVVEHDMEVVFRLADRIAVLVYGALLAFDTPDAVRANPQVQEAYLGYGPLAARPEPC